MFKVRWRKVLRDLWKNKTKTILVVLAIAVGIFAFGSVFICQDVLVADMNTQYLATNSPSIIINMSPFDDNLIRWAERQPDVAEAQGRITGSLKLIAKDGKPYTLSLTAYDDYDNIEVNKITPETGTFPPGRQEIVFERASIGTSGASLGDRVTVEQSNGRRYELTVAGTVHDLNAFPAALSAMAVGFVDSKTMEYLDMPNDYNQLNIVMGTPFTTLQDLEKQADTLRKEIKDRGFTVFSVRVQRPDEHWARTTTQSFTLLLSGIGFFSLFLSGFLVINTITSLIAQQRRQIGIMKAIGATGGQVTGLYLVLVAGYGLLALIVALPVGMGLAYVFCLQVATFLNINIINFHLPLSVFLMEFAAALVVPLVAAFFPIVSGVRVNVRETLSNYGIGGNGKSGLFDRMLIKVRGLPRPVLLSLRNTFRRKARLILTLGTLTLAGTLFISVMNVRSGLVVAIDDLFEKYYDWEVAYDLDGLYDQRGIEERALRIEGVSEVEGRTAANMQPVKADGSKGMTIQIEGLPPASKFVKPDITAGRWLVGGDQNALVVSSACAADWPGVSIGDTVTLYSGNKKYDWVLVGIYPDQFNRFAYANFDYLSRELGRAGLVSTLYVSAGNKDGASQNELAERLEEKLKSSGIKIRGSITRDTIYASIEGQNAFLISFLLSMAVMAAVIGGLGLMGLMSLNVLERTREIGVMRSIGAASGSVGSIVVTEGLIIGAISWLASIPLSIPFSLVFNAALGGLMMGEPLPFIFAIDGIYYWLAVTFFISVAASLVPAYRAMKMSIRETLAYE